MKTKKPITLKFKKPITLIAESHSAGPQPEVIVKKKKNTAMTLDGNSELKADEVTRLELTNPFTGEKRIVTVRGGEYTLLLYRRPVAATDEDWEREVPIGRKKAARKALQHAHDAKAVLDDILMHIGSMEAQ